MTHNKRSNHLTAEPSPLLWQRVLAGERLPKRLSRHPKCEGTVEDHRPVALDVRELIRKRVFEQPVGSVFHLNIAYLWLRVMRSNSSSLDLQLISGRAVSVPLVRASCGVMGQRMRLECPLCTRRVCTLYHLHQSRVSALPWPLVCGTAHQQLRPQSACQAENPPQAWRLRPTLGGSVPTKTARHVAADLRASLRGAGTDRTKARSLM